MSSAASPVPEGFHTLTPYLVVKNAAAAIEFCTHAFGAEEIYRQADPDSGLIINAQLRIGDSMIMLNDEFPNFGSFGPSGERPSAVTIHVYVNDVDAVFGQVAEAGATVLMPPADMFWGDRFCKIRDPFHHEWSIGTRVEDLSPAEVGERAKAAFSAPNAE